QAALAPRRGVVFALCHHLDSPRLRGRRAGPGAHQLWHVGQRTGRIAAAAGRSGGGSRAVGGTDGEGASGKDRAVAAAGQPAGGAAAVRQAGGAGGRPDAGRERGGEGTAGGGELLPF